jgi:hypothetical protein
METRGKVETQTGGALDVEVGFKKNKRFRAGAEIGGPVALTVHVSEQHTDQDYSCLLTIRIRD